MDVQNTVASKYRSYPMERKEYTGKAYRSILAEILLTKMQRTAHA
jgi:hypothetical protein